MKVVVTVLIAVAILGALRLASIAWGYAMRRRQENGRKQTCARVDEVVARAVALADTTGLVNDRLAGSAVWDVIAAHQAWILKSACGLRREANRYAFREASAHLIEALALLEVEVSRNRSRSVPNAAQGDDRWTCAIARLRERVAEVVGAARFMSIVIHTDGF